MAPKYFLMLLLLITTTFPEVSQNTGGMYLSQDLYTVKGNTISLPLSLNYSAGIQVNQRASWVGLGFDISLPFIERIPQGSVDEKDDDFICTGNGIEDEYWFYANRDYDKLLRPDSNGYKTSPPKGNFTNQQDYYYLNAHFASGRIIFGQPASNAVPMAAYLQNWRPVKIDYKINAANDIYKWEITDEAGVKYIFGNDAGNGVVRTSAIIEQGEAEYNTSTTKIGRNGNWITTQVRTPSPMTVPVITSDHYVNASFNSRWYLTEIISPNYDNGKGERIQITYTPFQNNYKVWLRDLFHHATLAEHRAATSLFRFTENDVEHAGFSFGRDNYYLHPVYPVDIIGPTSKIHFTMSGPTSEKLIQGDKRIESVEVYTSGSLPGEYHMVSKFKMNYSASGLGANHPYSMGGKGRLQLMSMFQYDNTGTSCIPVIQFEYASNPAFAVNTGFLMHDFYGYYRSTPLARVNDAYTYPVGQSRVGSAMVPEAEAWSIKRVIYSDGHIREYTYEPNSATFSSTNEPLSSNENKVMPGIRVAEEKLYDGISPTPITTQYTYDNGYIGYSSAIGTDINGFYTLINTGDYKSIRNMMVLSGTGVQYGYCKRVNSTTGSVESYFHTPAGIIPKYEPETPENLSIKDVKVPTSNGLINMAHCRGMLSKTEYRGGTNASKTISKVENIYNVKYDLHQYTYEETESLPLGTCATGGASGTADPVVTADNQKQRDFIGFVRLMSSVQTNANVQTATEYVKYNNTNAQPEIVRKKNSDGKQLLSKTSYAFENPRYSSGMGTGPGGAHMLLQKCQSITYEKPSGSTTVEPAPGEHRTAQATVFDNTIGCSAWLPKSTYVWHVNFTSGGIPDRAFVAYNHENGASNPNWKRADSVTKYTPNGFTTEGVKQLSVGQLLPATTIYGYNNTMPIGAVTNACWAECALFTGDYQNAALPTQWWDYENGWEKGVTNPPVLTASGTHFGQKVISASNDYAAGRNNRIQPGKAYIMTAWVKVTGGTIKMMADFRYLIAGNANKWPLQWTTDLATDGNEPLVPSVGLSSDGSGTWRFMKLEIPATLTGQLNSNKIWYARACIGDHPGASNFTALIDDIRFYPADAYMTSTYYHQLWHSPVLSVDANNNPGHRITHDVFGRKVRLDKIDPAKGASDNGFATLVKTIKYHFRNELPDGAHIQLLTPNGEQNFEGTSSLVIRWVNDGTRNITLSYRLKTGDVWGGWQTIIDGKPGQTGWCSHEWAIPSNTANYCSIKAAYGTSEGEFDESDKPFYLSSPTP